ncbi:MAG: NAD(P)/FAD-dependent oxidoreductase [Chitinophagales bacterium]
MKNPKTPFMRMLRKLANVHQISKETGIPEIELMNPEHPIYTRRNFLETTAKAGIAVSVLGSIPFMISCKTSTDKTDNTTTEQKPVLTNKKYSIAIIGGGIAGLLACHTLKKSGIASTVYEASNRTGGRMLSAQNAMGAGLVTEFGGEYLDTTHVLMFELMKEFGLETLDTLPSLNGLVIDDIFIEGKHHTLAETIKEFNKISKKIAADLEKIGDNYEVGSYADTLDKKSIDEYLVSIGCTGWFKKFIQVAYTSEFGCSSAELSSLNLITFIDTDTSKGEFKYFGDSDERYKVKGGNQQVVDKLAYANKDSILKEHKLTKVAKEGNAYKLTFENGKEAVADYVIMTIPFTLLRDVELAIDMPVEKKNAIAKLSYGTNAKMMFGMNKRLWRDTGFGGYLFNETIQNGWDNSLAQLDNKGYGGYTVFLGGAEGTNMNKDQYDKYLSALDKAYPGAKAAHNGKKAIMHWPTQPFVKGSYACFKKGDIINVMPHIATPVDNMYFAGEHCSVDFQGFMEGGAETGKKAAEEILKKITA